MAYSKECQVKSQIFKYGRHFITKNIRKWLDHRSMTRFWIVECYHFFPNTVVWKLQQEGAMHYGLFYYYLYYQILCYWCIILKTTGNHRFCLFVKNHSHQMCSSSGRILSQKNARNFITSWNNDNFFVKLLVMVLVLDLLAFFWKFWSWIGTKFLWSV